jgi:GNAT superfamily N-acetyltransferase
VNVEVRRIRRDEASRLRALRLRALADAPTAFGSTRAREEAFSHEVWRERAEHGAAASDSVTFIAEEDGEWIGMATGLASDPDDPSDSRPVLVGMFVVSTARGRGIGAALVEAVIGWARDRRAVGIGLWVTAVNRPAIALYEKCGFRDTGARKPLGHSPSIEELRMVRDLP